MNILRTVKGIELNEGSLMANGLFNVSTDKSVSFWFDFETKDRLMELKDAEFWHEAKDLIVESEIVL